MAEQTSRLAIIIDSTGAKNNADNLASSLVKMTQAGETAANSAGKVTKATEDEKNALAKLKAAIDPVGAAIDTVGRRYSELKKFFDKGLIDKEEYEFLVRKLNETTEELSGVAQAQRSREGRKTCCRPAGSAGSGLSKNAGQDRPSGCGAKKS